MSDLHSICVYCGSGPGADPVFAETAKAFGRQIAEAGVGLVYGGGNVGLMGAIARAVLDNGGQVTGIIPEFLKSRERMLDEVQETIIVPDMHTRKRLMFERADAFVALPGGHRHPRGARRADDLGAARPPHEADPAAQHQRLLEARSWRCSPICASSASSALGSS